MIVGLVVLFVNKWRVMLFGCKFGMKLLWYRMFVVGWNGIWWLFGRFSVFVLMVWWNLVLVWFGLIVLGLYFSRLRIIVLFVLWLIFVSVNDLCSLILMCVVFVKVLVCLVRCRNCFVICIGLIVWDEEGLRLIWNKFKIESIDI